MMVEVYNSSIEEAYLGRGIVSSSQPGLYSKILSLKKKNRGKEGRKEQKKEEKKDTGFY
jgi:hypothetical protein